MVERHGKMDTEWSILLDNGWRENGFVGVFHGGNQLQAARAAH